MIKFGALGTLQSELLRLFVDEPNHVLIHSAGDHAAIMHDDACFRIFVHLDHLAMFPSTTQRCRMPPAILRRGFKGQVFDVYRYLPPSTQASKGWPPGRFRYSLQLGDEHLSCSLVFPLGSKRDTVPLVTTGEHSGEPMLLYGKCQSVWRHWCLS